jgi:hypothetical protein
MDHASDGRVHGLMSRAHAPDFETRAEVSSSPMYASFGKPLACFALLSGMKVS